MGMIAFMGMIKLWFLVDEQGTTNPYHMPLFGARYVFEYI
jgi:hypothetical protein